MEDRFCFECLERRVQSDFSGGLAFSYGLSDSPLPFGSSAVVQVSASDGEASGSQFILEYLRSDRHVCLARYIDDCAESSQGISDENASGVNPELCSSTTPEVQVGPVPPPKQSEDLLNCGKDKSSVGSVSRCCSCDCSYTSSFFRTINAMAPIAYAAHSCNSNFEEVASHFLSGSLEDHILRSLSLLIEGKATGRDGVNFLKLVGVPSFGGIGVPGSLRHPNIAPVIGMLKSFDYIRLVLPKSPYTLENILHFSPNALQSEWDVRFLVYQLLSALAYLHDLDFAHGSLSPSTIMITKSCWSWISISDKLRSVSASAECTPTRDTRSRISCCTKDWVYQGLYADLKISGSVDWHSEFKRWWTGELSNFEYLLVLNRLAGRRWGDHTFHPVMPWVIDFSTLPDENSDAGWRDLSKSKWRLAKGDEQLDFTYLTSEIPHHVSDECLSELAVCSYKARRLPLRVLRLAVRSVYEPNEYPSTMQRLYQWTPDECIPEFYFDPQIFRSIHSGMTNLAIPSWASSPEEFIQLHRDALESERVSQQLHMWIDIMFGYKMSGEAAVAAKNVMLPSSDPILARSIGRRQLFNRPHPMRRCSFKKFSNVTTMTGDVLKNAALEKSFLSETANLEELEEAYAFSEHARHLTPLYHFDTAAKITSSIEAFPGQSVKSIKSEPCNVQNCRLPFVVDSKYLLEYIEETDEGLMGYQELLLWRQKLDPSNMLFEDVSKDIFSIGCVLAELHLKRPLFDPASLASYLAEGIFPRTLQELPPPTRVLVEACIQRDWMRRPTAKSLLDSPYFPASIRSSYLFVSPLQLLAQDSSRLQYLATFAKQGALRAMGTFAAEKSAFYCLPLLATPLSDIEAEWACTLLEEFIKNLEPSAVNSLIFPCIQKILQTTGYSRLKVSLLQDSFVREIWNRVGKYAYLEKLHPLVISNLHISPHKTSAAAASVLLIGSSEELGIPITIHQTILPLIHCFGKGLSPDGIDALIRIGGLLGDFFVVKQVLPLLKHMVHVCISVSCMNKPEPVQSWSGLALVDCLVALDGLLALLPGDVVVKELIQDRNCLHVIILMQTSFEVSVLQVAASLLLALCQRIGPDLTALHVLPQLKGLFDELAFSQETACGSGGSTGRSLKTSKLKMNEGPNIENRMDLVLLLYPSFATLLGIEKLRQCCATWLLLEQFLLRRHNWKWECTGETPRGSPENSVSKRSLLSQGVRTDNTPAKMLLNGVGWSIPQSQGTRVSRNLSRKRYNNADGNPMEGNIANTDYMNCEPWFWFPSPVNSWDGPEYLARVGSVKDELPWKIRACVLYSVRAHNSTLRSLAVCEDESTVFTAGIGPGFKGTVQKWDLMRMNSVLGYHGHEEVVNDICVLSSSGRIASCDGTVHVWNSRTGKVISVFSEPTAESTHFGSAILSPSSITTDPSNVLSSNNSLSSGLFSSAFDGNLYTCMHHVEFSEKLIVGTGNGSLRFFDVSQGQKLHCWRGENVESGFPSLVSTICSCRSDNMLTEQASAPPSWIATGLSSGHCRLFDSRSGNVVASWKAHDSYVTKLAAVDAHMLVSSSLDKTLRVWDLRRNLASQLTVFRGHTDGVSGFSMWGQDIVSISRNKIGLSSLSKSADENRLLSIVQKIGNFYYKLVKADVSDKTLDFRGRESSVDGLHRIIVPQKLHMGHQGMRNMSTLSSICILPFSRLFLVGTEDGYLRICN